MQKLTRKFRVWLSCVWWLGVTPRRLRHYYAELCIAVGDEPTEIAEDLFLFGDQCTSVWLLTPEGEQLKSRVTINAATYTGKLGVKSLKGISIQENRNNQWTNVLRLDPALFYPGEWIYLMRRAIRARVKAKITPLPLKKLGDFNG